MLRFALALALTLAAPAARTQDTDLVNMGTGTLAGVYFPVGVALCRLVNMDRRDHGIRCAARPSGGSLDNIDALRAGRADLAIIQSDVQAAVQRGSEPFTEMRAVMALYLEPLTVVARADTGATGFRDLEGLRVSHDGPDWGVVLGRFGMSDEDFAETSAQAPGQQARALCGDLIDAFALTIGHPALAVQEATLGCDARLVPVAGPEIDSMVAAVPFYADTTIPGGLYRGNPDPVATFGVAATLVTRADVPEDVVHTLVSSIFGRIDMLRGLHPALAAIEAQTMATQGLTAPLHPGAARFYAEQGWSG